LMEWCWAEAGYLIDFDEKKAILFGCAVDEDEFSEDDDDPGDERDPSDTPFTQGGLPLLAHIGRNWKGWTLVWDDHGVDAFAAHLKRRSISDIAAQPDSHTPKTAEAVEYRA